MRGSQANRVTDKLTPLTDKVSLPEVSPTAEEAVQTGNLEKSAPEFFWP